MLRTEVPTKLEIVQETHSTTGTLKTSSLGYTYGNRSVEGQNHFFVGGMQQMEPHDVIGLALILAIATPKGSTKFLSDFQVLRGLPVVEK